MSAADLRRSSEIFRQLRTSSDIFRRKKAKCRASSDIFRDLQRSSDIFFFDKFFFAANDERTSGKLFATRATAARFSPTTADAFNPDGTAAKSGGAATRLSDGGSVPQPRRSREGS